MSNFFEPQAINLNDFSKLCHQDPLIEDYPNAQAIEKRVVIYNGSKLRSAFLTAKSRKEIKSELYHCLKEGPGVFVIKDFYFDKSIINRCTTIFKEIINEEKAGRLTTGDHFAEAGVNERIWNSFQKVCEKSPGDFIDYYKNPLYQLVSETWLGPGYQITAQVNVVKPGGQAQSAHRDFHLGFQSDETVAQFPITLQIASQYLTIQGAVAHTNMPVESGPTLLLPYSQQYDLGYMAWRDNSFKTYFNENAIQLALRKGDAIFFSPALFHAAGTNSSGADRWANLIQISAAFGKPMETIDRNKIAHLCYPILLERVIDKILTKEEINSVIAAIADGYSFPTNLDVVSPVDGNAPETAQQLLHRALEEAWSDDRFKVAGDKHFFDRKA